MARAWRTPVASSRRRFARRARPVQARAAVRGVILLQLAANGAGALVVYAYLRLLFPISIDENADGVPGDELDLVVFLIYLGISILLAIPVNRIVLNRAVHWVKEGREPTDAERRATLTQPLRQTASAFLVWLGAAIIFGLLNENESRVAAGIVLAGMVTCALLYLLLERHFRPVFELALADAELPENRREIMPRIMLAWLIGSAIPIIGIGLAPVAAAQRDVELGWRLTVLVLTSIIAGGLVMIAAAGSVAQPINRVRNAMRRVEDGGLDITLPVDDQGEIGRLSAGFNSMVHGLRERQQLEELFGQQVGVQVAEQALEKGAELGGERRMVTVLFVDLIGYTAFAEASTPEQVVTMLNSFFQKVIEVVQSEGGLVNKFEGDAALCVFGAPSDQPDHAARALCAAARIPAAVAQLPLALPAGIGVATGYAVAGNIGTSDRYEYTVIGDVVNLAARLTELAKHHPTLVLAAADTVTAGGVAAEGWTSAGAVQVRGRQSDVEIFEPTGLLAPATR
jgi:adenylate cyclase